MNAQPTTELQVPPPQSKFFLPVVGLLFCLAVAIGIWQVTLGYQSVKTSQRFLTVSVGIGVAGTLLYVIIAFAQQKERLRSGKAFSGPLNWPFIVFVVIMPNFAPTALTSWFYPLSGTDEPAIRDQAQGMVLLGIMVTAVLAIALRKPVAASISPPREPALITNH